MAADNAAFGRPGRFAVDHDQPDAFRVGVRFFKSGRVADFFRVEENDVSPLSGCQQAPVGDLEAVCRQGGHPADALLEAEQFFLPHVLAQDAGKGPVVARVHQVFGRRDHAAVGGDHHLR